MTALVQLPSVSLSFVSGVCITRLLKEAGRGYYTLLQADVVLFTLLVSLNVGTGALYFLAKDEHGKERVISLMFSFMMVIALVLTGALASVKIWGMPVNPLFPEGVNGPPYVAYVAVTVFLSILNSLFHSLFTGLRMFRVVNQMTLLTAVLAVVVFGSLFLLSDGAGREADLIRVLVASVLILLCLNAVWMVYYGLYIRVRPVLSRGGALLKPLLTFVLVGFLATLLNMLNYRFDVWFVQEVRGVGELGLYAVAVGVAQFFFQVPEPIARVLQPHLIGGFDGPMLDKFRLYARLSTTLVLLGGGVLVVISEWLFPFLYGEAFGPSALAMRWLMPGILFACISKMMVLLVVRTGRMKYTVLASGVGLVVTIAMNFLLVPVFGIVGAAIASSLAYLVVLLLVLWVVFKRLGVPWGNYYLLMPGDIARLRS